MRRILAITFLVLATAGTASADVYRSVDAKGNAIFTDRWVPGSTRVKVDRSRTNSEAAALQRNTEQSKLAVSNDRIAAQQSEQSAADAVRQDVAGVRNEQCKQAKERYEKSIQARRLYRTGKDGEREYLSDVQADEERLQARMSMQQVCASNGK